MKKQLTKRHMTKFDYNIRLFSIITGIAFVAALAFITPLIDSVNASLNRTSDQIKIQMLEINNMNYDDETQDLHIHLEEGYQHLDGDKAEQLLRFRKNNDGTGYSREYGGSCRYYIYRMYA